MRADTVSIPAAEAPRGAIGLGDGRRCPHCGGGRLRNDDPAQSWEYAGERCGLLRCEDCEGLFSFPLPSPALIGRLYRDPQLFNYDWYRDHYPAKFLDAVQRLLQYRRLGLLPRRGRLLDYGGGVGYFARAARLLGIDAETRDPMYAPEAAAAAGPGDRFDVIACHHVLEHALDPGAILDDVAGLLAPGGALLVAVPNAASLGYRQRGAAWVWSQPPFVHVHHFTPAGLRALLQRHGFAVTGEHYFERWDASTAADVRAAERFLEWDGAWGRARNRRLAAQVNSLRRFAALAITPLVAPVPPEQRPELLVVARRAEGAR